jgi:FkbM family methyltransferase
MNTDSVVLDIGAHAGLYSVAAASMGARGIYSFEVEENCYGALAANSLLYPSIHPFHIPVWSSSESLDIMSVPTAQSYVIGSAERKQRMGMGEVFAGSLQTRVQGVSLDDLFPEDFTVGFVKIDVEGSELRVLQGMTRILNVSANVLVQVELSEPHLNRSGTFQEAVWDYLLELGFSAMYGINREHLQEHKGAHFMNVFFCKGRYA